MVMSLSIYAAIISTMALLWKFFEFRYDRVTRLSYDISYSNNFIGKQGTFTPAIHFRVINTGQQKVRITSIAHQFNDIRDTFYSPISQFITPIELNPGEAADYDIEYVCQDFGYDLRNLESKKTRLFVTDSRLRKHKSKWVTLSKVLN